MAAVVLDVPWDHDCACVPVFYSPQWTWTLYVLLAYVTRSSINELHSKARHWGEKHSFGKITLLSSVGYGTCRRWLATSALLGKCQQHKFPNVLALSPTKLVPGALLLLFGWEVVICIRPRFMKTLQYLILNLKEKVYTVLNMKSDLPALSRGILVKHWRRACRTRSTCSVNKASLSISQTVLLTNSTGTKVNKCLS